MYTREVIFHRYTVRRGFTLLQLLIVVVVLVLLATIGLLFLQYARKTSRSMYCSTYIRGLMQGSVIWAQSNGDTTPLPSTIDIGNNTIATKAGEPAESKNTSANVFSLYIFNGYIPPEMCVSPSEVNPHIRIFEGYAYAAPPTAANSRAALWDPAFNVDFTGTKSGGLSYAQSLKSLTSQKPAVRWSSSSAQALEAVIGNRGPQIASVDTSIDLPVAKYMTPKSLAARVHGGRSGWEGHIGFSDGSVDMMKSTFVGTYLDQNGKPRPDCLFFDEADADAKGNSFLGIFVKGGPGRKDFVSIWD